jgi:hypothetical protein
MSSAEMRFRVSSSGMFPLLKIPDPNSKPAIAPAPKRGKMQQCQEKNAELHIKCSDM